MKPFPDPPLQYIFLGEVNKLVLGYIYINFAWLCFKRLLYSCLWLVEMIMLGFVWACTLENDRLFRDQVWTLRWGEVRWLSTLFILMDCFILIDTISFVFNWLLFLVWYNKHWIAHCKYLGVSGYINFKNVVFFCLKFFFTYTNSIDPDEMLHYAAFHLGLHCLQKYLFRGFP